MRRGRVVAAAVTSLSLIVVGVGGASATLNQPGILLPVTGVVVVDPTNSPGYCGESVALAAGGTTALVGCSGDSGKGAVFAFARSGFTWVQTAKLTPSDATGWGFGTTLAVSADGNTAAIGSPPDNLNVGAVWIFVRSGSTWAQQGSKLTPSDESGSGAFGSGIALSADGNALVATAPHDLVLGEGKFWTFTRSGGAWTQAGPKQRPADAVTFGREASLSADGTTALFSGTYNDNGALPGAVWAYSRSGSGWSASGRFSGAGSARSEFGSSLALSAAGDTAMVGGYADGWTPDTPNSEIGAAWVFARSGGGWAEQAKLTGADESGAGNFGASVAISGDGTRALVGAPHDSYPRGAVWGFVRSGSSWTQDGAKIAGTSALGSFGASVALSADGQQALVGAPYASGTGEAWWYGGAGPVPPGPPRITRAWAPSSGQAIVSFDPPAFDGGSPIHSYTVTASPGGATASGPTSPITITGLQDGTTYTFTVTATNQAGTGPPSAPSPQVTASPTRTKPDPPQNVRAVAGDGQVTLSWDPPAFNGNMPITAYYIFASPGLPSGAHYLRTSASPFTITGLTNGTSYRFNVDAANALGQGLLAPVTSPVTPQPAGAPPPDLHVELTASAPSPPPVGSELDYTVKVTTLAGLATQVKLQLELPEGYTVVGTTTSGHLGCRYAAPMLSCDGPSAAIPFSAATPFVQTLQGFVNRTGELDATATATSTVEPEASATTADNTVTLRLSPPPATLPTSTVTTTTTTTPPKPPALLAAIAPPKVVGVPIVGRTLRAIAPRWNRKPDRVSYGWQRCTRTCRAIAGATKQTWKPAAADAGKRVRVVVTAKAKSQIASAASRQITIKNRSVRHH
jgi:hypothetical protein